MHGRTYGRASAPQVEGANGLQKLGSKVRTGGVGVLWHGATGAMTATFVGHYPWFFTYNTLQAVLPQVERSPSDLRSVRL